VNPTAIRTVDFRGRSLSKAQYRSELPRAKLDIDTALSSITPILETVKSATEIDLLNLCEKFDGVRPKTIRVPMAEIKSALENLDPEIRSALEEAIRRITKAHTDQLRSEIFTQVVSGGEVTHKQIPVDRVGLYVPGGRAVYPSSVIMNVVPAQIAKVKSIAIASPPQIENGGLPNQTILAACALLGVDEVYAIGGAQAIAMFAYGVAGVCENVDVVTGPGNIYVAAAKRALRGIVGIDSEAGPTEVAVLADESAIAGEVAADLISQAEHDVIAAAVLVTDSVSLADAVKSAKLSTSLALARYKAGQTDYTTVLSAEQALLSVELSYTGAQNTAALGAVNTYRSLGGGWQIRNGGDVISEAVKKQMAERTNWGRMLTPKNHLPAIAPEDRPAESVSKNRPVWDLTNINK
jgi:histidinol dehydrogenase